MRNFFFFTTLLLFFICFSCNNKPEKPQVSNIEKQMVFNTKVTENSHAATLVETTPNNLMAAWFGGSYEGAKDVGIYASFFTDNTWSSPKNIIQPLVKNNDTLPCWNPVLFKSKSEILYLFYKIGKNPREWFGAMVTSKDNGQTWSAPEYLPEGILGPIKNKPIEVQQGIILCGSSTESIEENHWRVHVEQFNEQTGTWTKIALKDDKNFEIIQPTFIEHANNTVQMLCRSKHNKLVSSWSKDFGTTWFNTDTINVVNSNSGVDALTLNAGSYLLVNNPLPQGADWFHGRNVLDVEYSNDGVTWEPLFDLEKEEKGQFSYPAIIQTKNKRVHVLYTFNRDFIKHVSFNID